MVRHPLFFHATPACGTDATGLPPDCPIALDRTMCLPAKLSRTAGDPGGPVFTPSISDLARATRDLPGALAGPNVPSPPRCTNHVHVYQQACVGVCMTPLIGRVSDVSSPFFTVTLIMSTRWRLDRSLGFFALSNVLSSLRPPPAGHSCVVFHS
jgi:hypothetical protein